jgi:branched-chain amino acid transport system permease protein
MIIDQILTGLATGCIYSLVAIGYSLIYSSMSLLHFAQGSLLMLGGVFGFALLTRMQIPFIMVIPAVAFLLACLGILMERLIYRNLTKATQTIRIICTLGVNIVIPNLVIVLWGSEPHPLPSQVLTGSPLNVFGLSIQPVYYWIFLVVTIVVAVLTVFLKKTNLGLAIRATAYNQKLASLMGVNTSLTLSLSFAIGSALAGIAGLLAGKILFISFDMGSMIGIKGFVAAVIGGFGNLPGAMVGGLILGVFENIGSGMISTAYKDSISFLLMIIILVVLPSGLLGKKGMEKV